MMDEHCSQTLRTSIMPFLHVRCDAEETKVERVSNVSSAVAVGMREILKTCR